MWLWKQRRLRAKTIYRASLVLGLGLRKQRQPPHVFRNTKQIHVNLNHCPFFRENKLNKTVQTWIFKHRMMTPSEGFGSAVLFDLLPGRLPRKLLERRFGVIWAAPLKTSCKNEKNLARKSIATHLENYFCKKCLLTTVCSRFFSSSH